MGKMVDSFRTIKSSPSKFDRVPKLKRMKSTGFYQSNHFVFLNIPNTWIDLQIKSNLIFNSSKHS